MDKFFNWIIKKPERFFGVALIISTSLILAIDLIIDFNTKEDWEGVLTEAHGMVLDILVFGILVSIYDRIRGIIGKRHEEENIKKEKIDRYLEEIEDFRYWNDDEARVRLIGNIKRLQKLNVTKLDLSECNLSKAILENISLVDSKFAVADMQEGFFKKVDFSNAKMRGVKMMRCHFGNISEFDGTELTDEEVVEIGEKHSVQFKDADLYGANFFSSYHRKTHFERAHLVKADFTGSILIQVYFEGATLIDEIEGEKHFANFNESHLIRCFAYESQREDFIKCGAITNQITFIDNLNKSFEK